MPDLHHGWPFPVPIKNQPASKPPQDAAAGQRAERRKTKETTRQDESLPLSAVNDGPWKALAHQGKLSPQGVSRDQSAMYSIQAPAPPRSTWKMVLI
ncbi:MAG: hypothetical protein ACPHL6_05210 [Rubripirellula sp.]